MHTHTHMHADTPPPHTHSQSHHQKRLFLFVYLPINWSLYTFARPFLRGPFWSGMLEDNLSAHFFCFFSSVFLYFHKAHLHLNVCIISQIYLLSIDSSFSGAFWWGESGNWIQSSWRRLQSLGLSSLSFRISFLFCSSVPKRRQTPASIISLALTLAYLCWNQKQSICYFIISTIYKDYQAMTCIRIKQWLPFLLQLFIIFSNKFSAY